ncbi:LuxR C-terminal-related transcriptional regulator [Halomonas sp. McH1-25]|uniref:LuxR C-terminal-related transcriptional regulator n=1 Tax=unclassified Halomonas TaxID=2609666 RepID=UPI001EF5E1BB|nr:MULTISPECIES: LuxR C-terminal-related transcriptional regulator [unclassified Halomonas]MCG7600476.1 LuxR C-terminal-related transcriptional regulator [Halomonas sp. McH1-25]MCP1342925.1 LuxR C-terminal-related transcriptional regulator [Halomonas sp. FL8]MCP1359983.1 LuxR C-terminal-related transcriptional regulator [Halomonas sp. BBD45]MCP1367431.1 LuxR C-terminal-related transcriptional regulator [Halomonas sp. BBD48]
MSQGKPEIWLVSTVGPQMQLFHDCLVERLAWPVTVVSPEEPVERDIRESTLVLLDVNHVGKLGMQHWHEAALDDPLLTIAAFNVTDDEHAAALLASLHLEGIFYRRDSLNQLLKGIDALQNGEWWLSRSLMARLIGFYRAQQTSAHASLAGLTHREAEVLDLLGLGASNARIARELEISDHTVKTHLYNLFRKLNVCNRFQAIDRMRRHCPAPVSLPLREVENG